MKDKLLQIRVDDDFLSKLEYLKHINNYKNNSDTVVRTIEKEFRKETRMMNIYEIAINEIERWVIAHGKDNDEYEIFSRLDALEQAVKYLKYTEWHYLNTNPSDYPHYDDRCLVCRYDEDEDQDVYELAWNPRHTTEWRNENGIVENVVAWKYVGKC